MTYSDAAEKYTEARLAATLDALPALTAFAVGQVVRAREAVQGMTKGNLYRVIDVDVQPTPFGTFVTYYVQPVGLQEQPTLAIGNGHFVMEAV